MLQYNILDTSPYLKRLNLYACLHNCGNCPSVTRTFFFIAGCLSFALGLIGIPLPLLPTVPFMILAAFCFAKSSVRIEKWLLDHPHFGPPIRQWRDHRSISRRGKWSATVAFVFSIAIGLYFLSWPHFMWPIIAALLSGAWIWTRPERRTSDIFEGDKSGK